MKTTIVIEDGRVTIAVDDGKAVEVKPGDVVIPVLGNVHTGPHHESKSEPATAPKSPKNDNLPDDRTCEECGGSMTDRPAIAKICGSPECKKARVKKQNEKSRRARGQAVGVGRGRGLRAQKPQGDWGHDPDNTPLLTADAPEAEPDFRSKCCDGKVEVGDDDEPICLACRNTCEVYEKPFDDPWNCGACRNHGRLCGLHHNLEAEGKKPPQFVHQI